MKVAGLLSLTLACATLLPATGYAAPSQQTAAARAAKTTDDHRQDARRRPASDWYRPRGRPNPTAARRPKALPNRGNRAVSGHAIARRHRPGPDGFRGASAAGLPGIGRPAAASLGDVRHRSPNPAVVGGSVGAHGRNTGTIDGTRMNRRP
jgi:hypothetical protein